MVPDELGDDVGPLFAFESSEFPRPPILFIGGVTVYEQPLGVAQESAFRGLWKRRRESSYENIVGDVVVG